MVLKICSGRLVAQSLAADSERQPSQETKIRAGGDYGGIGATIVRRGNTLSARIAAARAIAHGTLTTGLGGGALASQEAVEFAVAPGKRVVILLLFPVVVEVKVVFCAGAATAPSPTEQAIFAGTKAGSSACLKALGHGRDARVDVVVRKGVDAFLGSLVCRLEVVRELVQRAPQARVVAISIHGEGAGEERPAVGRGCWAERSGSARPHGRGSDDGLESRRGCARAATGTAGGNECLPRQKAVGICTAAQQRVREAGGRATGWIRQTRLDRGEEWRLEQRVAARGAHSGNGRPDRTLHRSYTAELAWGRV